MRKRYSLIISLLVSIAVLYLVFKKIDIYQMIGFIRSISPFYIFSAFIAYLSILFFRALRFKILLKEKTGLFKTFKIILIYNFITNITPMKLGEISFPYLMKKANHTSIRKSIFSLIVARLFDFFVLSMLLLIGIFLAVDIPPEIIHYRLLFYLLIILLLAGLAVMVLFHEKISNSLSKIKTGLRLIDNILSQTSIFIRQFSHIRSIFILLGCLISTIMIFLSGFIVTILLLHGMGHSITLNILLLLLPLTALSSIIPLNGIGGIGTYEGVWALVLVFYGYGLETSLLLGLSTHLIQITYILISGAAGWFINRKIIYGNKDSRG